MSEERRNKGPAVGRIAFNRVAEEVKVDLERGEWMTTIYERYKDRLPFSYAQFTRHVHRAFGTKAAVPFAGAPGLSTPATPPPPPPLETTPPPDEPRQAPADDRPRRFRLEPQSEDKLF